MFGDTATIDISLEEATEALVGLRTLRDLTPMEQAKLNIYDAIETDEKVIDLNALMKKAMVSPAESHVALAPIGATKVGLNWFRGARNWDGNASGYADYQFHAGKWSYASKPGFGTDPAWTATAVLPSIETTVKPKIEDGDLLLWEPVWQNVTEIEPERVWDPAVLRHLGGPMYKVIAAWDLTDLEARLLS